MLRIVLLGRTGNHLFQYALGRVLAEKHGVPLVMDASWFNAEGWAEVSHFLKLPLKAKVVRRCSLGARTLRKIAGKHFWEYRGVPVLREAVDDQSFDVRFLKAPADCMLFGYFQSPLYFESIAGPLREELNGLLKDALRVPEDLRTKLMHPDAVAVHVRRKDYLDQPVFQVCDSDYYQDAMREMRSRLPDARFYIFSDDPEWCRGHFTDSDTEVIDSGPVAAITGRRSHGVAETATGDRRYEAANPLYDLHLMSLASHHIIANSTYSWWAAWLGDKPGQRVILPDRWYAHGIKAPMAEKRWKRSDSPAR